jgi:hypothetical protein
MPCHNGPPSSQRVSGHVLRKELQDNPGSAKKWESRCWQGVYVGLSSLHTSSVALIYNPTSCHVTQQFHVAFDESFTSVASADQDTSDAHITNILDKASWLYKDSFAPPTEHHLFHDDTNAHKLTALHALYSTPSTSAHSNKHLPLEKRFKAIKGSESFELWKQKENIHADVYHCTKHSRDAPRTSHTTHDHQGFSAYFSTSEPTPYPPALAPTSEGALNISMPHVYQAAIHTQDPLTQSAMLKAPDKSDFVQAQWPEIAGLEQKGVFSYHPISSLPPHARLLNAIWSYKRKRTPTGV